MPFRSWFTVAIKPEAEFDLKRRPIRMAELAKIGKIFLSFQLGFERLEAGRPTNKVELYCNSSNAATLG